MNEAKLHELMDRIFVSYSNIEEFLIAHDASPLVKDELDSAFLSLFDAYQKIGDSIVDRSKM